MRWCGCTPFLLPPLLSLTDLGARDPRAAHGMGCSCTGCQAWWGTVAAEDICPLPAPASCCPHQECLNGWERALEGGTCTLPPLSLAEPGSLHSCSLQQCLEHFRRDSGALSVFVSAWISWQQQWQWQVGSLLPPYACSLLSSRMPLLARGSRYALPHPP